MHSHLWFLKIKQKICRIKTVCVYYILIMYISFLKKKKQWHVKPCILLNVQGIVNFFLFCCCCCWNRNRHHNTELRTERHIHNISKTDLNKHRCPRRVIRPCHITRIYSQYVFAGHHIPSASAYGVYISQLM